MRAGRRSGPILYPEAVEFSSLAQPPGSRMPKASGGLELLDILPAVLGFGVRPARSSRLDGKHRAPPSSAAILVHGPRRPNVVCGPHRLPPGRERQVPSNYPNRKYCIASCAASQCGRNVPKMESGRLCGGRCGRSRAAGRPPARIAKGDGALALRSVKRSGCATPMPLESDGGDPQPVEERLA